MLKKLLIKYTFISLVGYFFIFFGTALLVEAFNISPGLAYFIIVTLTYACIYIANTKFVFETDHTKERALKYVLYLIITWAFNNAFFYLLFKIFQIGYLETVIANIVIFGLLRFFIQKSFVFKK